MMIHRAVFLLLISVPSLAEETTRLMQASMDERLGDERSSLLQNRMRPLDDAQRRWFFEHRHGAPSSHFSSTEKLHPGPPAKPTATFAARRAEPGPPQLALLQSRQAYIETFEAQELTPEQRKQEIQSLSYPVKMLVQMFAADGQAKQSVSAPLAQEPAADGASTATATTPGMGDLLGAAFDTAVTAEPAATPTAGGTTPLVADATTVPRGEAAATGAATTTATALTLPETAAATTTTTMAAAATSSTTTATTTTTTTTAGAGAAAASFTTTTASTSTIGGATAAASFSAPSASTTAVGGTTAAAATTTMAAATLSTTTATTTTAGAAATSFTTTASTTTTGGTTAAASFSAPSASTTAVGGTTAAASLPATSESTILSPSTASTTAADGTTAAAALSSTTASTTTFDDATAAVTSSTAASSTTEADITGTTTQIQNSTAAATDPATAAEETATDGQPERNGFTIADTNFQDVPALEGMTADALADQVAIAKSMEEKQRRMADASAEESAAVGNLKEAQEAEAKAKAILEEADEKLKQAQEAAETTKQAQSAAAAEAETSAGVATEADALTRNVSHVSSEATRNVAVAADINADAAQSASASAQAASEAAEDFKIAAHAAVDAASDVVEKEAEATSASPISGKADVSSVNNANQDWAWTKQKPSIDDYFLPDQSNWEGDFMVDANNPLEPMTWAAVRQGLEEAGNETPTVDSAAGSNGPVADASAPQASVVPTYPSSELAPELEPQVAASSTPQQELQVPAYPSSEPLIATSSTPKPEPQALRELEPQLETQAAAELEPAAKLEPEPNKVAQSILNEEFNILDDVNWTPRDSNDSRYRSAAEILREGAKTG